MDDFTTGLENWVQKREAEQKKRRKDSSAVEFIAIKKDVAEAIKAGYSLKTIWQYLREQGKLRSTYETFRRHVIRFIKNADKQEILAAKNHEQEHDAPKTQQKPKASSGKKPKPQRPPEKRAVDQNNGFQYNATPNKEELI